MNNWCFHTLHFYIVWQDRFYLCITVWYSLYHCVILSVSLCDTHIYIYISAMLAWSVHVHILVLGLYVITIHAEWSLPEWLQLRDKILHFRMFLNDLYDLVVVSQKSVMIGRLNVICNVCKNGHKITVVNCRLVMKFYSWLVGSIWKVTNWLTVYWWIFVSFCVMWLVSVCWKQEIVSDLAIYLFNFIEWNVNHIRWNLL